MRRESIIAIGRMVENLIVEVEDKDRAPGTWLGSGFGTLDVEISCCRESVDVKIVIGETAICAKKGKLLVDHAESGKVVAIKLTLWISQDS